MTKACLFLLQADPLAAAAPAETSDDILAKYRKRTAAATNDEDLIDLSNSNEVILHEGNRSQVRSFFISSPIFQMVDKLSLASSSKTGPRLNRVVY